MNFFIFLIYRVSAPYPRLLCFAIVESFVATVVDGKTSEVAKSSIDVSGLVCDGNVADCTGRLVIPPEAIRMLFPVAERRIRALRSGQPVSFHDDESPEFVDGKEQKQPSQAVVKVLAHAGFEQGEILRLQQADPDFGDLVIVRKAIQETKFTPDELYQHVKAQINSGNKREDARRATTALREAGDYWLGDVLYKKVYDETEGVFGLRCVIPAGGLRSFWYNGRSYRLSLRKSLLLMFHDSEILGAHSNREDTLQKLRERCVWPSMVNDVQRWVNTCSVCKLTKAQRGISTETRTELHDRPFRVIFVDCVGPIKPTDRGFAYLVHASCPFSGYTWIKPLLTDDATSVARFLVEDVFFDIAGFPMVLRSDRGKEFTANVVRQVNELLEVQQAFGSSYHPQSQGHIEASHKRLNNVLVAYCAKHPKGWSKWAKLAQWAIRATPRRDKGHKSPYEIVTGLKPQGPIDHVLKRVSEQQLVSPDEYVSELQKCLKSIHATIADSIAEEAEKLRRKRLQEASDKEQYPFQLGDFVFVKRPPHNVAASVQAEQNVSRRLLPRADTKVYEVYKVLSPTTVVLCDPDTRSTELGFPQPVHVDRLISYDLCALQATTTTPLRLEVTDRNGLKWKGEIQQQTATGLVRIKWDATNSTELCDLAGLEYDWID